MEMWTLPTERFCSCHWYWW